MKSQFHQLRGGSHSNDQKVSKVWNFVVGQWKNIEGNGCRIQKAYIFSTLRLDKK